MSPVEELVGEGSLSRLGELLEDYGAGTVLLVTGKDSFEASGAQAALQPYLTGTDVHRFWDFESNPRIEDVRRGIVISRERAPDLVVAVGGGSVMDMAKLISVLAPSEADVLDLIKGKQSLQGRGAPLVAIPTTSGSGSEVTHFAVVYDGKTKYSVASDSIRPDHALVAPQLTYAMPPRLTATCGFDALSQAVESYWAVGSNEASQHHAALAIRLILGSLRNAVLTPDPDSRAQMAEGAHRAGKAIDISKTTGPHALSYPLTSSFGVPHGHAVALTLGRFFIVNSQLDGVELNESRGRHYLEATLRNLYELMGCGCAEECCDMWYELMANVGIETSLEAVGVLDEADRSLIVAGVNTERLGNNPIKLNKIDLCDLMEDLPR